MDGAAAGPDAGDAVAVEAAGPGADDGGQAGDVVAAAVAKDGRPQRTDGAGLLSGNKDWAEGFKVSRSLNNAIRCQIARETNCHNAVFAQDHRRFKAGKKACGDYHAFMEWLQTEPTEGESEFKCLACVDLWSSMKKHRDTACCLRKAQIADASAAYGLAQMRAAQNKTQRATTLKRKGVQIFKEPDADGTEAAPPPDKKVKSCHLQRARSLAQIEKDHPEIVSLPQEDYPLIMLPWKCLWCDPGKIRKGYKLHLAKYQEDHITHSAYHQTKLREMKKLADERPVDSSGGGGQEIAGGASTSSGNNGGDGQVDGGGAINGGEGNGDGQAAGSNNFLAQKDVFGK